MTRTFARYAWFVLGYTVLVVLWGAYVRATGSGAGCVEHWPLCNGTIIQRAPDTKTLIELSHRVTSGLSLIFVAVLTFLAFRKFPKGHAARQGATLSMIFLLIEAGLGAGLVLLSLVANNDSVARAVAVALHLINTFILLGWITYTAYWAQTERSERFKIRAPRSMTLLVSATLLLFLVVGASGAIVALGDTLFPAASLREGINQDFSEAAHFLIRLRVLHPIFAVTAAFVTIGIASYLRNKVATPRVAFLAKLATGLVVLQVTAGFTNMFLLAPVWLQMTHLLLADALWITLFCLALESLFEAEPVAAAEAPRIRLAGAQS